MFWIIKEMNLQGAVLLTEEMTGKKMTVLECVFIKNNIWQAEN